MDVAMKQGQGSWRRLAVGFIVMTAVFIFAEVAQAAPPCEEGQVCPAFLYELGEYGAGPGELGNAGGIAADPQTGHIFVADAANNRISQFDSLGTFIKAWGWGVRDGAAELQVCTAETGCLPGLAGSGPGQFNLLLGIALDSEGNIWTIEFLGRRLQKFTPEGDFVLTAGREVNKTKVQQRKDQEANAEPVTVTEAEENLCTAVSGDTCGGGVSGTGSGEFSIVGFYDSLEAGPDGLIYAGDKNRIQKFSQEGGYEGEIPLPGGERTDSLAISQDGRIYVINSGVTHVVVRANGISASSPVVREIDSSGNELGRLTAEWEGNKAPQFPRALATDSEGDVYVTGTVVYTVPVEEGQLPKFKAVEEALVFDDAGALINLESGKAGFGSSDDGTAISNIATNVIGDGTGAPGEVLVHRSTESSLAYIRSYGRPFVPPPPEPPEIDEQFALSATTDEARVEGLINPRNGTGTTYQVQYGTGKCSEGGCEATAPAEPAALGGGAVGVPIATGPVLLGDLAPGLTYHYRFVAQNDAGGPVFGEEGTFRTFAASIVDPFCPNESLRTGAAALLPDCRAYEMTTPADKEGGSISVVPSVPNYPAGINQASGSGDALTYSSYRAFADSDSAPYTSQYMARRNSASGWSSTAISPPRESGLPSPSLDTEYMLFLDDLSRGWLVSDFDPPVTEDAIPGYRNLYRRDDQAGSFEAQCPAEPPATSAGEFRLEPQGSSDDGSHVVFRANDKLTLEEGPTGIIQVYECVNSGQLRLVSVLPGGEASPAGGSLGTAAGGLGGFGLRTNSTAGAVSADGNRIFWTANLSGPGPLYVRIGGTKTVEISTLAARFRVASPDGTRVLYTAGDDLYEAVVGDESATSNAIAGEVEGFMGASADTQLVYFVSREDLDGEGGAKPGDPNLYLYRAESGTFAFIGALSQADANEGVEGTRPPLLTPVSLSPYHRSSRITADGLHAAFTSSAPLTGFDNTDQVSGEADAEVFLYDAETGELLCASCNPSGARPKGANAKDEVHPLWAAAKIPGWGYQGHASQLLSEDGTRLFFEALDRLALEDTNGVQDVYQWEAPGTGSCTESSPTYSPANGGCVDLISSGKSPQPSELVDASADGSDVFFKTTESLWAGDPGLADIYDARIDGGFPPPKPPLTPCQAGVNCQQRGPAPPNPPPGTLTFVGPGDAIEKPRPKPKKCRKGTRKVRKGGKVRCVKNNAKKSRRAGR